MKALIIKGKVVQVAEEAFPVHPDFVWVEVEEGVLPEYGWEYRDGGFHPPAPLPEEPVDPRRVLPQKQQELLVAAVRYLLGEADRAQLETKWQEFSQVAQADRTGMEQK